MVTFSYGITFDVENLAYAALDRDQSPESREYLDQFSKSRYFRERAADHLTMRGWIGGCGAES